jgi:Glu-tRNA(Gln) amidotransferase subunit E-like FAD-binding protein
LSKAGEIETTISDRMETEEEETKDIRDAFHRIGDGLKEYPEIAKGFVDRLKPPNLSGMYHTDEMPKHG